jgi:hypothetical protein
MEHERNEGIRNNIAEIFLGVTFKKKNNNKKHVDTITKKFTINKFTLFFNDSNKKTN